jgi:hypothetical protein
MAPADSPNGRDAEVRRLREELKQTQLRLEEVTNYYRGEVEAVRKRSEDHLLQVQADEAARRRRAEEQVSQVNAELKSARSESEKSKRRYQALLDRIEKIEAESRAEVTAERNRYEDSARAAWQTAEEEVERLNAELAELQRELEDERSGRQRLEQEKTDLEASYQRRDDERQKLINRLKRALQASEQRREALETEGAAATAAPTPAASKAAASGNDKPRGPAPETQVEPAAGWGRFQLGEGDDLAEEFLMIQADRSFHEPQAPQPQEGAGQAKEAPAPASGNSDIADEEAERLIMGVAVDQKVAQRQSQASESGGASGRAKSHKPPMPEPEPPWWRRKMGWFIAGVLVAAGALAGGIVWMGL